MMDASIEALISKLRRNELVALGSHGSYPRRAANLASSLPRGKGIDACKAVVRAAFSSKRLAVAMISGTAVPAKDHTELLNAVAHNLPKSRVVCLNLGEFTHADEESYAALESAIARSFVGNLYIQDPVTASDRARKTRLKQYLNVNKRKPGYRQQIARDDAWQFLKFGCNAWFNPKPATRSAALNWAQDGRPEHCKKGCSAQNAQRPGKGQRCRGISANGRRCCLCTRHASKYCHHHRF